MGRLADLIPPGPRRVTIQLVPTDPEPFGHLSLAYDNLVHARGGNLVRKAQQQWTLPDGFDEYLDETQIDVTAGVPGLGFGDDICVLWRDGKPAYWVIRDGQLTPDGHRCMQFAVQHRPVLNWLP